MRSCASSAYIPPYPRYFLAQLKPGETVEIEFDEDVYSALFLTLPQLLQRTA